MKRDCMLLGAALLGMLTIQGASWAEHWEFLGKHPEGNMYVDRDSVFHKAELTTFWARRVYYKPQESKVSKMKFTQQLVQQELDCGHKTMKMTQMLFLDIKGKPVGAYRNLKDGAKPIQAGGFFDKEAKMLCPAKAGKPVVGKPTANKTKKTH